MLRMVVRLDATAFGGSGREPSSEALRDQQSNS